MASSRTILPALLGIAARRTAFLWVLLRVVALMLSLFGTRTRAEFVDMFWSPVTLVWVLLLGLSLQMVMETQRWRESVLLGNLGMPRYTLPAMGSAIVLLLELALRAVRP